MDPANRRLRADKELVMLAVQNQGRALRHAAKHLREDRDVVAAACRSSGRALRCAGAGLRADRALVAGVRSEVNIELNFPPNFEGLVLGCIDADFCK